MSDLSCLKARLAWLLLALAYHVWLRLPFDWRVSWALLPYAGYYAHTKDFAEFTALQSQGETHDR